MTYRALKTFAGLVTMTKGKEAEVSDEYAADLLRAGYIEPVEAEKPKTARKKK